MMFERNLLYISETEQEQIKNTKVLIAGVGLGSVIAETALRLGFENITIIDGDKVELSNLNRQNFTQTDIGKYKTDALSKRLKAINPNVKITTHNVFLTDKNIEAYLKDCEIAINTLDFDTQVPFAFDKYCNNNKIPVIHPFNFGWAGCAFVVNKNSKQVYELQSKNEKIELSVVKFIMGNLPDNSPDMSWLSKVAEDYRAIQHQSPPQLSVASHITAGITVNLIFMIATGSRVKEFPYSYFLSTRL